MNFLAKMPKFRLFRFSGIFIPTGKDNGNMRLKTPIGKNTPANLTARGATE